MHCPDLLSVLTCPICQQALVLQKNSFQCPLGHTFDLAREGYVNLLVRQNQHGDTKEMLQARRAFLESGFYAPLAALITQVVSEVWSIDDRASRVVFDVGCGEGYYLGYLQTQLATQGPQCIGIDISKDAVRMAARRYPDSCFVVANGKDQLVIASDSVQIILNIFAPRNIAEFARVLAPQGHVLVVIPDQAHLSRLRRELSLLNIEEHKQEHVLEQFARSFTHVRSLPLSYPLHLQTPAIKQLVMMTPNYWHLSQGIRERLNDLDGLDDEASFVCMVFRK